MEQVPWRTLCLCFSFVLFFLAAIGWAPEPWPWRLKLMSGGLAFLTLAQFIGNR
jgi:hypothetical protein